MKTLPILLLAASWLGAQPAAKAPERLDKMPSSLEVRFALSALPTALRENATVYVLDPAKGYVLAREGTNGQSCFIGRTEWKFADYRNDIYDPVCYDAVGAKTHMRVWFDVAELRAKGVSAEAVKKEIEARFKNGTYKAPEKSGFSYMTAPLMRTYMSLDPNAKDSVMTMSMPHVMYYAPNITQAEVGGMPCPPCAPYPFVFEPGPHGYIIQRLGDNESTKIVADEADLVRDLCSYNSVLCLPKQDATESQPRLMTGTNDENQHTRATLQAIEQAARDSYGRLLAFLTARCHDVASAEDALADAFAAALQTWPRTGIPEKPEAWLLVSARRKLIDRARHSVVHAAAAHDLVAATEHAYEVAHDQTIFPDERLKLLFVCAHPAIDEAARTPLMLQTVLGLDAARIASAFLVRPTAMGQRLTRAKAKIRLAGIRFEVPERKELPERLGFVLEAVYAAYGSGWDDLTGADPRRKGLAAEAIHLGRLLVELMPAEPEAKGLLALMLHCEARRDARRTADGAYVPLLKQDVTLWSKSMMDEAEHWLANASRARQFGRFQFEAAIQSAHAQRTRTGTTDWNAIALLYEGLVRLHPTIGAFVGRAAAVAEAHGPSAGWALLEAMLAEEVASYQPYWALAAHLLERMGQRTEAETAYRRAIGLCEDAAMRDFLVARLQNRGDL